MRSAPVPADPALLSSFRFWNRRGLGVLTGRSGIYAMAHVWQARLALRGHAVHVVDCAIRADADTLVAEALNAGIAPELLLQTITLQRVFTPYQILDVLRRELSRPPHPGRLVFILAPCKQFFDGDVAADEGVFLLNKLLMVFRQYRAAGRPLLVVESDAYAAPAFLAVYRRLLQMADTLFEYKGPEEGRPFALAVHRAGRHKTISGGRTQNGTNHYSLFHSNGNGRGASERFSARLTAG